MNAHQAQALWLTEVLGKIKTLSDELRVSGDVNLPRGFALGQVMDAVTCLHEACGHLRNAIRERTPAES